METHVVVCGLLQHHQAVRQHYRHYAFIALDFPRNSCQSRRLLLLCEVYYNSNCLYVDTTFTTHLLYWSYYVTRVRAGGYYCCFYCCWWSTRIPLGCTSTLNTFITHSMPWTFHKKIVRVCGYYGYFYCSSGSCGGLWSTISLQLSALLKLPYGLYVNTTFISVSLPWTIHVIRVKASFFHCCLWSTPPGCTLKLPSLRVHCLEPFTKLVLNLVGSIFCFSSSTTPLCCTALST